MSKIINLRMARKHAARAAKRVRAEESAASHGLTKAERAAQKAATEKARAHLDAHKRET